jgi:N-acetylmuramoyl-L-alanine amidase
MNGALPKPLRRGRRFIGRWGSVTTLALLALALVVSLRVAPANGNTAAAQSKTVSHDRDAAPEPEPVSFAPPKRLSVAALDLGIHRIVIDAGHGGTSLGTSAATGLREKDITLDIAARLGRRLAAQGVTVQMTRDADATLSLRTDRPSPTTRAAISSCPFT